MATRASEVWDQDDRPRVVGDVIIVDVNDVDASDRLRPIDMAFATALGSVMIVEGQKTPITVVRQTSGKPWRLVAGGHRHAAGTIHPELQLLKAIETEGGQLRLRIEEISENIWRKELDPLDRANFVAEMHEALRAQSALPAGITPQQIAAGARWKKDLRTQAGDASAIVARAYGFSDLIAEQLKLSRRTIVYDLMLARRITPSLRSRLQSLPLYRNAGQLRALAKLDQDEQGAVVELIVAGEAKSIADALARLRGRAKPDAEERRLSSFIGTFSRMSLAEKKGALAQLGGMLPAGFTLHMPGDVK